MTGEEAIAAQLDRRLGSLSPGHRHLLLLEQPVSDGVGGWRNGPHTVGWVERVSPGGVMIRLVSTEAGRTARAMLEEQLLDVVLSDDYPPAIRLTVLPSIGDAQAASIMVQKIGRVVIQRDYAHISLVRATMTESCGNAVTRPELRSARSRRTDQRRLPLTGLLT